MRLWSIHPSYLDCRGLIALWREGLLAQKVLLGNTIGYKHHPQLFRFKNTPDPVGAIALYLRYIALEAQSRGYQFDKGKIVPNRFQGKIALSTGQIRYEFNHLLKKLKVRDPDRYKQVKESGQITLHPLFREVNGGIEAWEKIL